MICLQPEIEQPETKPTSAQDDVHQEQRNPQPYAAPWIYQQDVYGNWYGPTHQAYSW